jgi:hypothetical protein
MEIPIIGNKIDIITGVLKESRFKRIIAKSAGKANTVPL